MTVKVSKPAINVREELADLKKPTGIAGEAMLRAETPQEQFNLIGAGRRNLIINGDMQVAQRGTSFTSTGYTLDRFDYNKSATDQFAATVTQSSDSPNGFASSLKLDVTTAESTLATDEYVRIIHPIESQDLQPLAYGTSGAKSITLSFWVKSSVTGTYAMSVYMFDGGGDVIGSTYTINSANTWEYKTITFAGNTAAAIANDNTAGFYLNFILLAGSAYTSSDNTTWGTYTGSKFAYGHKANFGLSTSDDFYLTGVQLELGKVATPFEHRSYGEELALCQRYYYTRGSDTSTDYVPFATGWWRNTTQSYAVQTMVNFPVQMRAIPSVSVTGSNAQYLQSGTQSSTCTFYTVNTSADSKQTVWLDWQPAAAAAVNGIHCVVASSNSEGQWIRFDAEL